MSEKTAINSQQPTANKPEVFPLISVIVPVYNTEKYLARCVNSILTQTYPNIELILIDDGSTDKCPAMCDGFAREDSRVKVIHKENGGAGLARNAGLDIARGELIGTVDSDDYIAPDMYMKLYCLMRDNDADICICDYTYVTPDGMESSSCDAPDEVTSREEALLRLLRGYSPTHDLLWNKLYRAEVIKNIRFPPGNRHDDSATSHRILGNCRKIAITHMSLYFYFWRANSVVGNIRAKHFDVKSFIDRKYAAEDRYEYLKSIGMKDFAELAIRGKYGVLMGFFKKVNYFQYRKICRDFARTTLKELALSRNFGNKLRAVRLALFWLRSIFRPFVKDE